MKREAVVRILNSVADTKQGQKDESIRTPSIPCFLQISIFNWKKNIRKEKKNKKRNRVLIISSFFFFNFYLCVRLERGVYISPTTSGTKALFDFLLVFWFFCFSLVGS